MKITRELLEQNGITRMESKDGESYLGADVMINKCKKFDGWHVMVCSKGELPDNPLEETQDKVVSGYVTDMEEIDKALDFCGYGYKLKY